MAPPSVSLSYVLLYVRNVPASLAFYEKAFGLARRFFNETDGKAYGEMETGATRLAFATLEMAKEEWMQDVVPASLDKAPLAFEIALTTPDVPALFERAVKAGAVPLRKPASKPWGQMVASVRDMDGHVVELCTPLP